MKVVGILKLFYFTHFMSVGVFFPFLNLYLKQIGLRGSHIGIITAGGLFLATLGQPVWGVITDIFAKRKKVLQFNLFLSLILVLILSLRKDFFTIFILLLLFRFIRSPLMRIIDTMTLTSPDIAYGRVRLWGSVGFGSASILAGKLLQETSLHNFFYFFVLLGTFCLLISFFLPSDKKRREITQMTKNKLVALVKNRTFSIFLLFSFLVGLPISMNSAFFSIYLSELGAKEGLVGLSWAVASFSNIIVFFYSDNLLKRFGLVKPLFLGAFLFGIRWLLYAFISNPFVILAIQAMHGVSFALFYSSGVSFVSQITPSELQVTGQGIFGAFFTFGLSGIAGSLLGGIMLDTLGTSAMYAVGGTISLLAAFLFLWSVKAKNKVWE